MPATEARPAPRVRDLTGKRFGNLTVTERAGSTRSGNATWWCECDCGNITRTVGTDLRLGRSRTCGCAAAESTKARHRATREALVGQKFGRLTVVRILGLDRWQRAVLECVCECGRSATVSPKHLQEGSTVSCGCRKSDPRPGARREDPGYVGAHYRVKFERGSASAHACVDCEEPAQDWSYDYGDPDQFYDERNRPYSANPRHYHARCRPCHRAFDVRIGKAMRKAQEKEGATP